MPNYKESALTAQKWTRTNRIVLSNPYAGAPGVAFDEEEITLLSDGRTVNTPKGAIRAALIDPAQAFDVIDPTSGSVVGQATHGQVYALIYSLYLAMATARDNAPPPPPPEVIPE